MSDGCGHVTLTRVSWTGVEPCRWMCSTCGMEVTDLAPKLQAALAENDATVARAAKLAAQWAEIEAGLQSRLDSMRSVADERSAALTAEVARAIEFERRLDRARLLAHSWADTPFTTMDRSTMQTLSAEMLRVLGEKWIAESSPGVVERREPETCEHRREVALGEIRRDDGFVIQPWRCDACGRIRNETVESPRSE